MYCGSLVIPRLAHVVHCKIIFSHISYQFVAWGELLIISLLVTHIVHPWDFILGMIARLSRGVLLLPYSPKLSKIGVSSDKTEI